MSSTKQEERRVGVCASRYLANIISSSCPILANSVLYLVVVLDVFSSFFCLLVLTEPTLAFSAGSVNTEKRDRMDVMLMPGATRTLFDPTVLFSVSLQPLPSSFATHLSSHPRDVLQVGLCVRRNCYITSNTCTSSLHSLMYRLSHSRGRECCAKCTLLVWTRRLKGMWCS